MTAQSPARGGAAGSSQRRYTPTACSGQRLEHGNGAPGECRMPARTKSAARGLPPIAFQQHSASSRTSPASAKIPGPEVQGGERHQPKGRKLDSRSQRLGIVSHGICWTRAINEKHSLIIVF